MYTCLPHLTHFFSINRYTVCAAITDPDQKQQEAVPDKYQPYLLTEN